MRNLLTETKDKIVYYGKSIEDITFIGSRSGRYKCTWDEFSILANKTYDNGFGVYEVCIDLIMVFECGGVMHRQEYDGSEWWSYTPAFKEQTKQEPIVDLFCSELE